MAFRVPVATVSVVDLTAELEKDTSVEELNQAFSTAANGSGWLGKILPGHKLPEQTGLDPMNADRFFEVVAH